MFLIQAPCKIFKLILIPKFKPCSLQDVKKTKQKKPDDTGNEVMSVYL